MQHTLVVFELSTQHAQPMDGRIADRCGHRHPDCGSFAESSQITDDGRRFPILFTYGMRRVGCVGPITRELAAPPSQYSAGGVSVSFLDEVLEAERECWRQLDGTWRRAELFPRWNMRRAVRRCKKRASLQSRGRARAEARLTGRIHRTGRGATNNGERTDYGGRADGKGRELGKEEV